jgi:hypothetical protein
LAVHGGEVSKSVSLDGLSHSMVDHVIGFTTFYNTSKVYYESSIHNTIIHNIILNFFNISIALYLFNTLIVSLFTNTSLNTFLALVSTLFDTSIVLVSNNPIIVPLYTFPSSPFPY